MNERLDEEEWERIFAPVRHLRYESGPVTLSEEYLELVHRVEAMPENQSGADKSWVSAADRAFRSHFARTTRVD